MRVVSRQIRIRRLEGSLTGCVFGAPSVAERVSIDRYAVRRAPQLRGGVQKSDKGFSAAIARDLASILHEIESGEGRVNDQIHA